MDTPSLPTQPLCPARVALTQMGVLISTIETTAYGV
jgi:hypothetical protein